MDKHAHMIEIGIMGYEGAQAAAILGMTDLLLAANGIAGRARAPERPQIRVCHWSLETGRSSPGRSFDSAPQGSCDPAVIIVPPGLGGPLTELEARVYAGWLVQQHAQGAVLCSICKGAFLLGETGLLDGRTVTTHWSYAEPLLERFPKVLLNTDRLIIDDGDIITAGGVMAWIDLSLILVARFLGPAVMMDTARAFLVDPPGREQSFYSPFSPRLHHGDAAVLKVQHWLQATGGAETRLPILADHAGLEPRTFMRRFQKATGHTTGDYVQRLRVTRARDLLQLTRDPVDAIAWQVHYKDTGAFRKVFTRIVGLSPGEYRQRFRVTAMEAGHAG